MVNARGRLQGTIGRSLNSKIRPVVYNRNLHAFSVEILVVAVGRREQQRGQIFTAARRPRSDLKETGYIMDWCLLPLCESRLLMVATQNFKLLGGNHEYNTI